MIKNFCRKRRSILWYSKRQIVWNLNENKIPPLQTIRNEKPHRTPQCGPDNVKCFIYVSGQFAFHGTINSSFRSLRRGTARAVGQIQDDSVWANKRSTDRPLGGQTRSNVANVVIVIGLIFRCGAAPSHRCRRYGCGSLRIHETVETRLCSSFRQTDAILAIESGARYSVTSSRSRRGNGT